VYPATHGEEINAQVLRDLMMPDVSGYAVVEAIQRSGVTSRMSITFVTAKSVTGEDRSELRNASE
jgi:CheY-like chemotaxis protein